MRRVFLSTVLLTLALACSGEGPTERPPVETGSTLIVSAVVSSAAPYYAGDSVSLTIVGGVAEGATGPDSIVVPNGNPRVMVGGNYTGKALMTVGSNTVGFTVYAKRSLGTPTNISGTVGYTATLRPVNVRLLVTPLAGGSVSRVRLQVGTATIEVPTDTTVTIPVGTIAVGISSTDTLTRQFGEMYVGADTLPIASNLRTHQLAITRDTTVWFSLLTKNNPDFTPEMHAQFKSIWEDPVAGTLHPTKRREWEFYNVVAQPSDPLLATSCAAMTPEQVAASTAAFNRMVREDSSLGVSRRTFTIRSGDPIAEGKYIQVGGFWRPAPGVIIRCVSPPPNGEDNSSRYDVGGFFEAYRFRSGGTMANASGADVVYGELKDFVDMVRNGQEGNIDSLSRNTVNAISPNQNRGPLDVFVYNHVLGVAWRAGQRNFPVLKGPQ